MANSIRSWTVEHLSSEIPRGSVLLAVRSELLEEAPQIFGFLLVLNPRKRHFGARNLRPGIFDVFLEGPFVPDDPGIFVRIRVIVAWHRACLASFQAVLDWADHVFCGFAYAMAGHTFLERSFSRGDISSNGRSRRGRERDNRNRNPVHILLDPYSAGVDHASRSAASRRRRSAT